MEELREGCVDDERCNHLIIHACQMRLLEVRAFDHNCTLTHVPAALSSVAKNHTHTERERERGTSLNFRAAEALWMVLMINGGETHVTHDP